MNREALQILDLIIKPVNQALCKSSESADKLVMLTGEAESSYDALRQVLKSGNYGRGHSWWQIEEPTFNDIMHRYLTLDASKLELRARLLKVSNWHQRELPSIEDTVYNIRLAAGICRIKYVMVPEALPKADDLIGMANYWLKYYNAGGKGDIDRFVEVCKKFF